MGTQYDVGYRMSMDVELEVTTETRVDKPFVGPVPLREGQPLYGRGRETRELADLLVSERIVVLMSQSGAGKTSLIHAGLLPLLRSRRRNPFHPLPTVRLAQAMTTTEGNPYVHAMLRQLEAERDADKQLPSGALFAHSLASYFRERFAAEKDLLLLVLDQFEELFTMRRSDTKDKHEFIAQLSDLLAGVEAGSGKGEDAGETEESVALVASRERREPEASKEIEASKEPEASKESRKQVVPAVWALISMREEFLAELEPLRAQMPTGLSFRYRLLPLDSDAAFQAIHGPAAGRITEGAARHLVDDLRAMGKVGRDEVSDASPTLGRYVEPMLLQVSCLRLWERVVVGEKRPVTVDDIEGSGKSGQVDAALGTFYATVVDTVAREVGTSQRVLRDYIERGLITASGLRARPRRDRSLGAAMNAAIDALERQHVLRFETDEGGQIVELVHDRLIAPILADNEAWRDKHLSLVQKAAALWENAGHPREMLLYGENLDRGREQIKENPEGFTASERSFIEASMEERSRLRRERVLRRSLIGLCIVLSLMCGAVSWLYQEVKAIQLRHLGTELRTYGRPDANDELLDAATSRPSDMFDGSMMQVLGGQPPAISVLMKHKDSIRSLVFAPDGSRVFSAERGGTLHVALFPQRGASSMPMPEIDNVNVVAVQPDGKFIAVGDNSGMLRLWRWDGSAKTRVAQRKVLDGKKGGIISVAFDDKGAFLAAATVDKGISIQSVDSEGQLGPEKFIDTSSVHRSRIYRVAFVPRTSGKPDDVETLVSGSWDGSVALWSWDTKTGDVKARHYEVKPSSTSDRQTSDVGTRSLAVSPDGRWLVVGDSQGFLHVWDMENDSESNGESPPAATKHAKWVTDLAFSPDGKMLVSVGLDEVLKRYDFNPKAWYARDAIEDETTIGGWGEKLYSAEFSPLLPARLVVGGGQYVRSMDVDGLNALTVRIDAASSTPPRDVTMSGDGKWVLALRGDGSAIDVWIRNNEGKLVPSSTLELIETARRIAMSPDAESLAILRATWDQVDIVPWEQRQDVVGPASTSSNTCEAKRDPNADWRDADETSLAFDPKSRLLVMLDDGAISLRRKENNWAVDAKVMCGFHPFAIRSDGRALAFVGSDRLSNEVVLRLTSSTETESTTRPRYVPKVTALAFSKDGDFLVKGLEDGSVWAWQRNVDMFGRKPRLVAALHHADVRAMAYVPGHGSDGTEVLITVDREGTLGVCRGNFAGSLSESTKPQCGKVADVHEEVKRLIISDQGQAILVTNHIYVMDLRHDTMLKRVRQLAWCKGENQGDCDEGDK